jgi:PAS domain-containing protein
MNPVENTAEITAKKLNLPGLRDFILELLVSAIEQAAGAILITDTSGRIQYVNPLFTTLTGYSAQDVVGRHTRILKSDRQDPAFYHDLWTTITAGNRGDPPKAWTSCGGREQWRGTIPKCVWICASGEMGP